MEPISSASRLAGISGVGSTALAAKKAIASGPGFGKALEDALKDISRAQNRSANMAKEFQAENPAVSLEETMIAMQKSSLSFQGAVQVRNKLVTAYNDIMNMQV